MGKWDGCFVTSFSHWSYPKPCAAVTAAWLFCFSHPYKSTRFARLFIRLICILKQASNPASSHKLLLRSALVVCSHKKAHAVRVGFVTPSGFKPETF